MQEQADGNSRRNQDPNSNSDSLPRTRSLRISQLLMDGVPRQDAVIQACYEFRVGRKVQRKSPKLTPDIQCTPTGEAASTQVAETAGYVLKHDVLSGLRRAIVHLSEAEHYLGQLRELSPTQVSDNGVSEIEQILDRIRISIIERIELHSQ